MRDIQLDWRAALAAVALCVCGALNANAQSAPGTHASGPTDSSGSDSLEEITVSAQRRGNERLLDTPMSIGVLSGADLDVSSSRGVSDALSNVGGVVVHDTQPGQSNITIRGITAGTGAPTTGFYLDEVPFAFIDQSQSPDANAFDLQRVEVLRGPQGTLFGAGAMGGVVRILTNDADLDQLEGKARASGSYTDGGSGNYGADLMLNVPLIPGMLAIRGVASYSDLSGFISSSADGNRRINDSQLQSFRLKIDAKPSDELSINLGYSHSRIDNSAPSTATEDLTTPFGSDQADTRAYDTYNLIVQYDFSSFTVLSSSSYLNYAADTNEDILLSGVAPFSYFNHYGLSSAAEEVRFNSKLDGPIQWSAGGFYKHTNELQIQTVSESTVFPLPYVVNILSKSLAVFGELSEKLGDKLELTEGLRYFRDNQDNIERSNFFPGPLAPATDAVFDHVTGRVVLKYNIDTDHIVYGSVASGFRSGLNQSAAVLALEPNFAPLKPDSLITYELGTKGKQLDGKLSFDAAVYYTNWTDVQQSLILPVGFAAYVNAGNAHGVGVDASAEYQPTTNFAVQADFGWNGITFADNIVSGTTVLFASGDRLNESPAFTATLGSTYHFPIGLPNISGVAGATENYNSSQLLRSLSGSLLTVTRSENIFRTGATIGVDADRWSAEFYGENLFNNREALTPPDVNVDYQSIRLRPRTIGLRANYKF